MKIWKTLYSKPVFVFWCVMLSVIFLASVACLLIAVLGGVHGNPSEILFGTFGLIFCLAFAILAVWDIFGKE